MVKHLSAAILMVLSVASGTAWAGPVPKEPVPPPEELRVGRIMIEGNTITPDWIILQTLDMYPGQTFEKNDVADARMRLNRVHLFQKMSVIAVLNSPGEFKDIVIKVVEKPNVPRGLGFYWRYRLEALAEGSAPSSGLHEIPYYSHFRRNISRPPANQSTARPSIPMCGATNQRMRMTTMLPQGQEPLNAMLASTGLLAQPLTG